MSVPPEQMGFLGRIGGALQRGVGGLGGALFPTDPTLDPGTAAELQRNALIQLGLGTLAGAQGGGTLGGSLLGGFQQAQNSLAGAQRQAFQGRQLKNQEEREDRLEQQQGDRIKLEQQTAASKAREQKATIAQRIASGISKSGKDPLAYYSVVSQTPEFKSLAAEYGFDASSITTPEQVLELGNQLGALGGVGAPTPAAPGLQTVVVKGPDGKPIRVLEQDSIGKEAYYAPPRAGLSVELADGTIITDGAPGAIGAGELAKPTVNKLQESIVNAQSDLDRFNQTLSTYKPEFLQAKGLIKAKTGELTEFLGGELDPEAKKYLADYSEFRSNAINGFNRTLKDLSGSAASDTEVKRVRAGLPSEEDKSPTQFEGKAKATVKSITRIIMRSNYALKNGIGVKSGEDLAKILPLEGIDAIYEARVNDLYDELGGTDQARAEAIKRANQEFGLAR